MTSTYPASAIDSADLTHLNTMRLGCTANKLIPLHNEADVEPIVTQLQANNTPLFILSGGSNIILPTQLHAHVLQPLFKDIHVISETENEVEIEVMGGENWHELVVYTVNKGWYGLENLALIPGLTGAAPVQNIGAYGVQLDDRLTYVKALHLPTLEWHTLDKQACQFDYRDSKFKREAGQWLITRVGFKLHKDKEHINANYGDVSTLALSLAKQNARRTVTPADVMNAIIEIRQSKLPDPQRLPNCGSFFKNPIIPTSQFTSLQQQYASIVGYTVDNERTKVAAGWLIDHAGLKGKGIEPILTHAKQALVLVNHTPKNSASPATQADILATEQFIQQHIKQIFGIDLEREPVWIDSTASYNIC